MGRPQETFNKKEKEKLKLKKKKDKLLKKEARKANPKLAGEDMYVYVDENGHLTDTPPDPTKKIVVDVESIEIGIPKREEQEAEDPIKSGIIDFFNTSKGFGFIKEVGTGEKYFVHINGMIDELKEGNLVSFELERGPKGLNAVNVRKA
jgi:cold shock CspA family protein